MSLKPFVFATLFLPLGACVIAMDLDRGDDGEMGASAKMQDAHAEGRHDPSKHAAELPAPPAGADADAMFTGTDGTQTGRVIVTDGPNGVLMRVDLSGLAEGFHGVHLHQIGDCSDPDEGFKASGSHVNPQSNAHGLMNEDGYELADLPNIYAHHSGHARAELFAAGASLDGLMDADGFAVLVHENQDDHITQPIGGAGGRVACAAFKG